jgi:hypothetical protein
LLGGHKNSNSQGNHNEQQEQQQQASSADKCEFKVLIKAFGGNYKVY